MGIATAPQRRRILVPVALLALFTIGVMLLTSQQMSDLRGALPMLSNAMSWLEGLDTPFDMDHVAMFFGVAGMLRVLLPSVRWWVLLLALGVLAAGTELLQFFTVGRTPKLLDARDDMVGAGIGLLLGSIPLWCARWTRVVLWICNGLLLAGMVLLPFQQWSPIALFGHPILPSDLLFATAIAVRGFAWAGGKASPEISGFHGWLAVYVLAMLLAVFVLSPMRMETAVQGMQCAVPSPSFAGALAKWIGVVWLALIAAMIGDAVFRAGMPRRLVLAWLLGCCIAIAVAWAAIVGFYLGDGVRGWIQPLLSHYGSLPPGPYPRVHAAFANANMFGLYLLLSVGMVLTAHEAGWLKGSRLRYLLAAVSVPILATASPAIGATAFLLGLFWWRRPSLASPRARHAWLALGMTLALLNLAALVVNPAAPFAVASVRVQLWQEAWLNWVAHPWRGTGLNQPVAGVTYVAPDGSMQYLTDAHNIVLNIAAQAGVIAVVAFLGLVAWVLVRSRGVSQLRWLWLAFLLAIAYLGIGGSFEDARVLWVAMGLLAGAAMACTRDGLPPACADDAYATA